MNRVGTVEHVHAEVFRPTQADERIDGAVEIRDPGEDRGVPAQPKCLPGHAFNCLPVTVVKVGQGLRDAVVVVLLLDDGVAPGSGCAEFQPAPQEGCRNIRAEIGHVDGRGVLEMRFRAKPGEGVTDGVIRVHPAVGKVFRCDGRPGTLPRPDAEAQGRVIDGGSQPPGIESSKRSVQVKGFHGANGLASAVIYFDIENKRPEKPERFHRKNSNDPVGKSS